MRGDRSNKKVLPRIILTEEKIKAARRSKIRITPGKIFRPTVVEFPPDNYKTGRSLIIFKGHAHRGVTLRISGEGHASVDVAADDSGYFVSPPVRLHRRVNTFTICNHSVEQSVVPRSSVSLTVYLDASLSPFFKRIDPITRTRLDTVDIFEVVRCRVCGIFQLLATWTGFSICPICHTGSEYWSAEKDEFWAP